MKKKIQKPKASTMTPIDQLNKAETIEHYNAVMIEELKSQFKFVIERSEGAEERTQQLIGTLYKKTQERFDDVDLMLHRHSGMFEDMDQRFNKVDERFEKMDLRFDHLEKRFDGLEVRVDGHDRRFDSLEKKMDEVVDAVRHHEKDIHLLKKAV